MIDRWLNPNSIDDYRTFLAVRKVPQYEIRGNRVIVPDEYADRIGIADAKRQDAGYVPSTFLFDYQRAVTEIALRRRKFAVFADCGLGKTLILLEFARQCSQVLGRRTLIVSPLMVVSQTVAESVAFYGDSLPIEIVPSGACQEWLDGSGPAIGITNYEAFRNDLTRGNLGALILDESSMLKSHYGRYGQAAISLGKGLEYKLCLTGTPAPNDRIEFANHAVFLDSCRTVNAFLAKYFVNRGETENRWELMPHALRPFYRDLSHWCIFLSNPAVYGWKDNCESIPPIHVHIHEVDMTPEQRRAVQHETGTLIASNLGGISSRGKLGQIAKGQLNGESIPTNKPEFIRSLVKGWSHSESTLLWCRYDAEQESIEGVLPKAGSISGSTKIDDRERMVSEFKRGALRSLISKPRILGFGLNLQIATRQVFSGLQDSYEEYYQAVKRSNRYGSTRPLNVHIPITEVEEPMVANVLRKADRVQRDTEEQEQLFKDHAWL